MVAEVNTYENVPVPTNTNEAQNPPVSNAPHANGSTATVTMQAPATDTPVQVQVQPTGALETTAPYGVERTRAGRTYTPAVDIYETNDALVIVADMPGVDENSVEVNLEKNVLSIYGHVQPYHPEGHNLVYWEYGVGDYYRSFIINEDIDWEHVQGTVSNGVLRLTLPKAAHARTRKIAVHTA
jgi:HSP20 family molecular chaperone IbpA